MDEIESNLILPRGALPLARYARYYTEDRGRIHAIYTTEIEERPSDYGCEEVSKDSAWRDAICPAKADLLPGRRRWVSFRDYMSVKTTSENCHSVQVMYDLEARMVGYAECNYDTDS